MISLPLIINQKIARQLKCGECTACCFKFSIDEINKPDETNCIHQLLTKGGCGIHDQSNYPRQCREFNCLWVQNLIGHGGIDLRPDKCGLIFTIMVDPPLTNLVGVFEIGKINNRTRQFLWQMEKKQLYFHEGILRGPIELLEKWKALWNIKD